ncbi:MAG: ATP-grasp domain-containing protein [Acidobacteria bacterium]|nr:ATP-grasp domain-containing protein [Acidobacteriota bacterium]
MKRVLLLATTTGYQTRSFGDAASALGVELIFGLDRCRGLEDPWGDHSLAVRFYDDPRSVAAIASASQDGPISGILALGDQPTVLAARAAELLHLPFHSPAAARTSRNKLDSRNALMAAGLRVPWFAAADIDDDHDRLASRVPYPSVIKPLALSGSRGVIRVDNPHAFSTAFRRVRQILRAPDIKTMKDPALRQVLIEGYIPGVEFAVEGLMHHGVFEALALFDKPDPLDGPFFEETIYVTPSAHDAAIQEAVLTAVAAATAAIGLSHGPVHAECRANADGVFVLEVAARPIGGLCARALRFDVPRAGIDPGTRSGPIGSRETGLLAQGRQTEGHTISLEELLLRHALGEDVRGCRREACASGVMMMPIPNAGVYRGVRGVAEARAVALVEDVIITAKPGQRLVPLPEGASYLGFMFATAGLGEDVVAALRAAHGRLHFDIDRELPLAPSG